MTDQATLIVEVIRKQKELRSELARLAENASSLAQALQNCATALDGVTGFYNAVRTEHQRPIEQSISLLPPPEVVAFILNRIPELQREIAGLSEKESLLRDSL
jgi:hypothetical protein